MHYILMCRSLTIAQKAARKLQSNGIFATATKAPQSANPGGCTYGAKIGARNLRAALALLESENIPILKLLELDEAGGAREVWL